MPTIWEITCTNPKCTRPIKLYNVLTEPPKGHPQCPTCGWMALTGDGITVYERAEDDDSSVNIG